MRNEVRQLLLEYGQGKIDLENAILELLERKVWLTELLKYFDATQAEFLDALNRDGINQKELAAKAGVDQAIVTRAKNGETIDNEAINLTLLHLAPDAFKMLCIELENTWRHKAMATVLLRHDYAKAKGTDTAKKKINVAQSITKASNNTERLAATLARFGSLRTFEGPVGAYAVVANGSVLAADVGTTHADGSLRGEFELFGRRKIYDLCDSWCETWAQHTTAFGKPTRIVFGFQRLVLSVRFLAPATHLVGITYPKKRFDLRRAEAIEANIADSLDSDADVRINAGDLQIARLVKYLEPARPTEMNDRMDVPSVAFVPKDQLQEIFDKESPAGGGFLLLKDTGTLEVVAAAESLRSSAASKVVATTPLDSDYGPLLAPSVQEALVQLSHAKKAFAQDELLYRYGMILRSFMLCFDETIVTLYPFWLDKGGVKGNFWFVGCFKERTFVDDVARNAARAIVQRAERFAVAAE
jgi:hypothetical protein